MCRYARIGWVVTVWAVVALGVQPAPANQGKHKPKPDLFLTDAFFLPLGHDHALRGEENRLRFEAETENRGRGAAKPSETEIIFLPPQDAPAGAKPVRGFSLDVPRLRGASRTKYFSDFGRATSPPLTFSGKPLGGYEVVYCADAENVVKESNERNNCRVPGGHLQTLSLAKRTWTGTLSGSGRVGRAGTSGADERWTSTDAKLVLERVSGSTFYYRFAGTVSWTMQGTDATGCSWSGAGTDFIEGGPGNGEFVLDVFDGYTGILYEDLDYSYPVSVQCGAETSEDEGPFYAEFLNTRFDDRVRPFPFGTEVIAGSGYDDVDQATWTWEFR